MFPVLHAGCRQFLLPGGFFQAGSGCCSSDTLQHSQGDRTSSFFRPTNSVLHLNNPQPAFLLGSERPEPRGSEPGRGSAFTSPSPLYRSSTLQLAKGIRERGVEKKRDPEKGKKKGRVPRAEVPAVPPPARGSPGSRPAHVPGLRRGQPAALRKGRCWHGSERGAGHGPGPRGRAAPMARRAQARRGAPGRETCSVLRRRRPWPDPPGGSGEGAARRGARRTEPSRQAAKRALDPRGRSGIRRPPHPTHAPALRGDPARPRGQREGRRCPHGCPRVRRARLVTATLNDSNKRKGKLSRYLRRLCFDAAYRPVSRGGGHPIKSPFSL